MNIPSEIEKAEPDVTKAVDAVKADEVSVIDALKANKWAIGISVAFVVLIIVIAFHK